MVRAKIRVMMVEDSVLHQHYLARIMQQDDCLDVVAVASTAQEALDLLPTANPDVITLDLNLPDMDGAQLLPQLLEQSQAPVLAVSSSPRACVQALEHGAADFLEKLQDVGPGAADRFDLMLRLKLKSLARAKVEPGRAQPAQAQGRDAEGAPPRKRVPSKDGVVAAKPPEAAKPARDAAAEVAGDDVALIAIGASLGGTEATLELLELLPADMPPIVVVQHMPPGFTEAYALRLDRSCALQVAEARQGMPLVSGQVLVARGGQHLTVQRVGDGLRARLLDGDGEGFCPAVDVLFASVAKAVGAQAIGVLLTGMGRDGAQGLQAMHQAGSSTFGQSEETCAVFGMPAAAQKLGAVDQLLSPQAIAQKLVARCGKAR